LFFLRQAALIPAQPRIGKPSPEKCLKQLPAISSNNSDCLGHLNNLRTARLHVFRFCFWPLSENHQRVFAKYANCEISKGDGEEALQWQPSKQGGFESPL
jgi:hypothetical protein